MNLNYERDPKLFHLLWYFRVATTRAIHCAIFSDCAIKTCYERLIRLERRGFVRRIAYGAKGTLWTLGSNGFIFLKAEIPELKLPGFGSDSPEHDLLVAAISHEDFWPDLPTGLEFLCEEVIKRYPMELLPSWYPKELLRRPDGIWKIESGGRYALLGLEVETNLKTTTAYQSIASQYEEVASILRVLWFVKSKHTAESIKSHLQKRVGSENFKHNFILLSDFITYGWGAPIVVGRDVNLTPQKLLHINDGITSVLERRLYHFDISCSPHKSKFYEHFCKGSKANLATYWAKTPLFRFCSFERNKNEKTTV